ncbi:hypothetical protein THAOC_28728, partial [Thalassiosira oceanica]
MHYSRQPCVTVHSLFNSDSRPCRSTYLLCRTSFVVLVIINGKSMKRLALESNAEGQGCSSFKSQRHHKFIRIECSVQKLLR